jgi:hypothetical protein
MSQIVRSRDLAVIHRLVCAVLLAVLVTPTVAAASTRQSAHSHATAWRAFTSKKLGIAFRYPATWRAVQGVAVTGAANQVMVSAPSPSHNALTAQIVPVRAAPSLRATMSHFLAYQRAAGDTNYARVAWSSTSLGKRPAMATVIIPPTEGGALVSQAIYLTQWRSRVYQVTLFSLHKPALARVKQFLPVYGKILATWRFI